MKKRFSAAVILLLLLTVFSAPVAAEAATITARAGTVATKSSTLNVRSGKSTESAVVYTLKKGSYITLISKSGSWWYVEYAKDAFGYCHADYIQTVSGYAATVHLQAGHLNVRSGGGLSYGIKDKLTKGENVVVLSTENGWSRILYHGTKIGYVSRQYLLSYPAISLKTFNFKQTDGRWADVKIGTSGKTIGQIGCTTTAIAILESYRTGTTIYPDAMSKKLKYTDSGSVYWPEDYQVVLSDGTEYLKGIYTLLQNKKPVLFGASSSGKQHWVIITGYTGGNSLSASQFTIRDPGSNSRTTLQQLLNSYPTFYKYFYYK